MRPITPIFLLALLQCAGAARSLYAQDICEPDRVKFCPGYRADDPLRLYCLKRNESQIKPSCKAQLRNVSGTEADFIEECTEDYETFCADVRPGKGRILKCLKQMSKDLSFECRKKVSQFPNPK